ncbi:hypothetical protein AAHC03_09989 [Spirometra sp. Aus1]
MRILICFTLLLVTVCALPAGTPVGTETKTKTWGEWFLGFVKVGAVNLADSLLKRWLGEDSKIYSVLSSFLSGFLGKNESKSA